MSRKTAEFTVPKKNTEHQASGMTVRSGLKIPKLKSVKCSKKGILTISWKKDRKMLRKVEGYEIQLSPNMHSERETMVILKNRNATRARIKVKGAKLLYIRFRYYSSTGVSAWSKMKKTRVRSFLRIR